jgi:hypothetical protein
MGVAWSNAWKAAEAERRPLDGVERGIKRLGEKAFTQGEPVEACPEYVDERHAEMWRSGWYFMQSVLTAAPEAAPIDPETGEVLEQAGEDAAPVAADDLEIPASLRRA